MNKIIILSASVRTGRKSHHVALYFEKYIREKSIGDPEIIDLQQCHFPLFNERLKFLKDPGADVLDFAQKIRDSRGVIIVSPEYNGGIPASLKNVIDLLSDEWKKKPVSIVTVSSGNFGGSQVLVPLQFSLWKIGALTVPAMFPVPNVEKSFNEKGEPLDREATDKRAAKFLDELRWMMDLLKQQQ